MSPAGTAGVAGSNSSTTCSREFRVHRCGRPRARRSGERFLPGQLDDVIGLRPEGFERATFVTPNRVVRVEPLGVEGIQYSDVATIAVFEQVLDPSRFVLKRDCGVVDEDGFGFVWTVPEESAAADGVLSREFDGPGLGVPPARGA